MEFVDRDSYKGAYGIYMIKNVKNGKVYIGQTKQRFNKRYWHHKWMLKNKKHFNKLLQSDYNKGFEFVFIVLCKINIGHRIPKSLDELEIYYIDKYKHKTGVYNLQSGGKCERLVDYVTAESRKIVGQKNKISLLGKKHSEETKQKMRASSKHLSPSKETREKVSTYMKNRVVSDITRKKLRDINTGSKSPVAKLNEQSVKEIKQMLILGFKCSDIAKKFNVSYSTVDSIKHNRIWRHVKFDR